MTEQSLTQADPVSSGGKVIPISFAAEARRGNFDLVAALKTEWKKLKEDTPRGGGKPVHVKGTFPLYLLEALESAVRIVQVEIREEQEDARSKMKYPSMGREELVAWKEKYENFSCNLSMASWACVRYATHALSGHTDELLNAREGLKDLNPNNDAPDLAVSYAKERARRLDFTIDGSRNLNFELSEEAHNSLRKAASGLCLDDSTTYKLGIAYIIASQPHVANDRQRERACEVIEEYIMKAEMAGRSAQADLQWCQEQTAIRKAEREQREARR
jgi:hypothetical protein